MSEAVRVVGSVTDAVTRLESALDELSTADLGAATDEQLLGAWRRLEAIRRRLEPVDHGIITEVEARSLPSRHACTNTAALARQLLRISPGEAAARVRAAQRCGPRTAITGQPLAPQFPAVAAAQARGQISAQHARTITDTITGLPTEISAQMGQTVEDILVDFAAQHDPRHLARHAHDLAYALDQDGQYDQHAHRERTRGLWLRRRADGSAHLEADLDAECAEHLHTHLDALAKPAPADDSGLPDPRTPAQRRHDALLAMLKLVERAELLPLSRGVTATILLTMPAEAYATGTGTALTGHGYSVPADLATRWAGPEARVLGVVLSRTRGIEAYSTTQRLVTEQQRLALITRDRGCSFPSCDAAPQRCEAHHVTEHQHSNRTSVDDTTLLCPFHHRHHHEHGWTCRMINGRPWWIPPAWLDPQQTPRRNTMHDHAAAP